MSKRLKIIEIKNPRSNVVNEKDLSKMFKNKQLIENIDAKYDNTIKRSHHI